MSRFTDYVASNFKTEKYKQSNDMAKVIDYAIITSSKGTEHLESLIKENVRLGWQPIGGITVMNSNVELNEPVVKQVLIQVMVLYDN